ncbi:hypothetical protein SynROS8604_03320 [Synechococcus sp. ROS8604]|nr:hypothetical protein SynROS8604_03320 [Synechococcus sp. ROS8604]
MTATSSQSDRNKYQEELRFHLTSENIDYHNMNTKVYPTKNAWNPSDDLSSQLS